MGNLYRKVNAIQKYLLSTEGKAIAKEFSDEIASAEDRIDQSRMDEFIDDIARGYGVRAVEKSNGYEVSSIQENKMESKKYKLLESKLRKMVREELFKEADYRNTDDDIKSAKESINELIDYAQNGGLKGDKSIRREFLLHLIELSKIVNNQQKEWGGTKYR